MYYSNVPSGFTRFPPIGKTGGGTVAKGCIVAGIAVVVVVVVVGNRCGIFIVGGANVEDVELTDGAISLNDRGQQTPGTKRLLKHNDCRKLLRFSNNCGQSLKSSQYLK